MNAYLQSIAQEWMALAAELAEWAYERMVNRTDVWGSYLATEKRRSKDMFFFTAPFPSARGKQFLTKGLLAKHFAGLDGRLISLHSTSADKTSRWLAIDIDRHDGDESGTENNAAAALAWHDRLLSLGFDPLLLDSNGDGGFHLLVVFAEPVPTSDVYNFGQNLVADWAKRGLAREPETYPKQACLEEGHVGNCLRLFGRHHTREHFTRVWSGEPGLQDSWLEGAGAVERILQTRLADPALLPRDLPAPEKKKNRAAESKRQRPRVCVDLDGVLASYDGWKGLDITGAPLPGAVEFTRRLREIAEVVIFTTRCCVEAHREELREPARPASDLAPRLAHNVRYWLEKHRFAFDEIYVGQGKPIAAAYIDDRAVACAPQNHALAYAQALQRARELCSARRASAPPAGDAQLQAILEAWPELPQSVKTELAQKATANSKCKTQNAK